MAATTAPLGMATARNASITRFSHEASQAS